MLVCNCCNGKGSFKITTWTSAGLLTPFSLQSCTRQVHGSVAAEPSHLLPQQRSTPRPPAPGGLPLLAWLGSVFELRCCRFIASTDWGLPALEPRWARKLQSSAAAPGTSAWKKGMRPLLCLHWAPKGVLRLHTSAVCTLCSSRQGVAFKNQRSKPQIYIL